jgi:hypothetical protein
VIDLKEVPYYGMNFDISQMDGLIPTEEIEEFHYTAPYEVDEALPCDQCRGQGVIVSKRYSDPQDTTYTVRPCAKCETTAELTFLCEECGAAQTIENLTGQSVIYHKDTCQQSEYCYQPVGDTTRRCMRKVVERFDIRANGRPVGVCGVHARGMKDREAMALRQREDRLLTDWRYKEREAKEATVDERIAAVARELGTTEVFEHRIRATGEVIILLPLPLVEAKLGIAPEVPGEAPPPIFEEAEGPDPF